MLGLVLTSAAVADIDISVRNKPRFSTFTIFSKTKQIHYISKFTKYGKQAFKFYINIP